jgi:hypothetical protein
MRDNLAKRRHVDDTSGLFCNEKESVSHLFFECCVAKLFWSWIVEITGIPIGADFESVAKCWLSKKRFSMLNMLSSAVLWSLWKLRNDLCFQVNQWKDVRMLVGRCARMLGDWRILQKSEGVAMLERWAEELERRAGRPAELTW